MGYVWNMNGICTVFDLFGIRMGCVCMKCTSMYIYNIYIYILYMFVQPRSI